MEKWSIVVKWWEKNVMYYMSISACVNLLFCNRTGKKELLSAREKLLIEPFSWCWWGFPLPVFHCFPSSGWIKAGAEVRCWELSSGWVTVSLPKVHAEAGFCEQSHFHENNTFTFINNRDYWQSVNQPGFLLDMRRYPGESKVWEMQQFGDWG